MSSYGMELRDRSDGGEVLVSLTGELDLTNARELERRLDEVAPADVRLVIDLNGVAFMDSAALHVLFKVARRRGRERLAIVADESAPVARTLAIVGLSEAADVHESREAVEPRDEPA
jgi:anti-sigma B factor antagonist